MILLPDLLHSCVALCHEWFSDAEERGVMMLQPVPYQGHVAQCYEWLSDAGYSVIIGSRARSCSTVSLMCLWCRLERGLSVITGYRPRSRSTVSLMFQWCRWERGHHATTGSWRRVSSGSGCGLVTTSPITSGTPSQSSSSAPTLSSGQKGVFYFPVLIDMIKNVHVFDI